MRTVHINKRPADKRRRNQNMIPVNRDSHCVSPMIIIFVMGTVLAIHKYAPTKEKMKLTDYFVQTSDNESSVILNGEYCEVPEGTNVYSIIENDETYLSVGFIKEKLDDGYVYDDTENILRYTTDSDVISVNLGDTNYTVNKDSNTMNGDLIYEVIWHIFPLIL